MQSKTRAKEESTRNDGKKGAPTHPQSSMTHSGSSPSPYENTKMDADGFTDLITVVPKHQKDRGKAKEMERLLNYIAGKAFLIFRRNIKRSLDDTE